MMMAAPASPPLPQEHYLELCDSPVQFEKVSAVNNVFFDEANKQVFAVRSGGATGVVVKGPDDKSCISFSDKVLQVGVHTVFIPSGIQNTCDEIVLSQMWETNQECVGIVKSRAEGQHVDGKWEGAKDRSLEDTRGGDVDVHVRTHTGTCSDALMTLAIALRMLCVLPIRSIIDSKSGNRANELGAGVGHLVLRACSAIRQMLHEVTLLRSPKSSLVSNLATWPSSCGFPCGFFELKSSKTSLIFDIKLRAEFDGAVTIHHQVLSALSIHPCKIPRAGPSAVTTQSPVPCELYSSSWSVFQPDIIINASEGYLWCLQIKLQPIVHLLQDKGRLMDFLLQRKDCKMVTLSVCNQMLSAAEQGSLPVIATIFDKLNQVYKEYLEAEQNYTLAMESGTSRSSSTQKRPVRTQAVIDQSDMYTHVLSVFTEKKQDLPHKFVSAVLMEYIRSLNQYQLTVQHYLYELVIKTLVQHSLFYMLHQFLQYHVLSDSKPLACLLLSLESTYPPAHQLSLDMLKRLSTANDEIVEVLLSKHQVLGALRFVRSIGSHDNISARKFLDVARQTGDAMLFYTTFKFFEQRNQRLRGSSHFTPGEHCEEHITHFKSIFGEQALLTPMAL
ncbi:regulator of MON1-CCZ1 complex [Heterodontus francisci]|uniref:regulator of MON1-CCZ1 complex n=1 Tax=Heterodontus francisci TaxID=7792 RepID=UPI00355B0F4A